MLRPRKKIAKKEIKEDALVTFYFKAQKLFNAYRKQIEIALIAVLAVTALGVLMARSKKSAERQAAGKLGLAEPVYFAGEFQRAVPELKSIEEKFPGTQSAGKAVFYQGNAAYAMGDIEQAEKCYRRYVDDYGQNREFKASSLAGLAAVGETRKQYGKAAALYEEAGKKYSGLYSAPFYLKNAGRCYVLANDKVQGKRIYQFLKEKYPDSFAAQEIDAEEGSL